MNELNDESYFETLHLLLEEDQKELQDLEKEIKHFSDEILECELYIQKMEVGVQEEYRLFSPRNQFQSLDHSILEAKEKKNLFEEKRRFLYQNLAKLQKRITNVNKLKDLSNGLSKNQRESNLSSYSLLIQEKERERIARDLHDTSLQNITHMIHKVELVSKYIDVDMNRARIELSLIAQNLRDINQEIRNTIYNLKPMVIDDLGFSELIERLKDNYSNRTSMQFQLDIDPISNCNDIAKILLYRIIDEAVNNAVKHSNGTEISILVKEKEEKILVKIQDNGIGIQEDEIKKIDLDNRHFGLKIMQERIHLLGGELSINGKQGTTILIEVPIFGGVEYDTGNVS